MNTFALRFAALVPALALSLALAPDGAKGPKRESLVLKVDGEDITLKVTDAAFETGDPEVPGKYFRLCGEGFENRGLFDTNGNGEIDDDDVFRYDAKGNVRPASIVNRKSPVETTDDTDTFVVLPGLGRCGVIEGSTFTVKTYTPGKGPSERWSGTLKLRLRTEKGTEKTVEGAFESSVLQE